MYLHVSGYAWDPVLLGRNALSTFYILSYLFGKIRKLIKSQ